jgi:hypothetical protein
MELQSAIQTNNQRPLQLLDRPNADRKGDGVRGGALTWISSFLFWNDFFGDKTEFRVADCRPGSECDACRMRSKRLRQTEYHHRRITCRDTGNVANISISLSSWRTNHSPPCSPRSTLSPIFAIHLRARYPHMAAVCSFNNNNFAPCLTVCRSHQGSA